MARCNIFLVDGNMRFQKRLRGDLRERGCTVFTTSVQVPNLGLAEKRKMQAAAVDVSTHGGAGLNLIPTLRSMRPDLRIIALAAYADTVSALEAMRRGANFYLCHPVDADDVLTALTDGRVLGERFARTVGSLSLAVVEWHHIQRVVMDCAGNISASARQLRIARRTLQLRLRRGPPVD